MRAAATRDLGAPTVAGEQFHEYQLLSINKGKLYRLSTITSNKRWPKRKELYKNIVLSFVPKGF